MKRHIKKVQNLDHDRDWDGDTRLMLTLHRWQLLEGLLTPQSSLLSAALARKVRQPLVAAACSLRPGGKFSGSEDEARRIRRKARQARSRTRGPAAPPRIPFTWAWQLLGQLGLHLILHGLETSQSKSKCVTWA